MGDDKSDGFSRLQGSENLNGSIQSSGRLCAIHPLLLSASALMGFLMLKIALANDG
jgi:hypothetical protein